MTTPKKKRLVANPKQLADSPTLITMAAESFIMWKKVASEVGPTEYYVAALLVNEGARVVHFAPKKNKKLRVSKAFVVGFFDLSGKKTRKRAFRSLYNSDFKYAKNKVVKPTRPFSCSDEICGSGIHGFMNFEDAVNY